MGHDLVNDPKRRNDTLKSIKSETLFFSGPLTLIQNGKKAIIARKPCYASYSTSNLKSDSGKKFWGFVTLLTLMEDIFENIHLERIETEFNYQYKLINRVDGKLIESSSDVTESTVFDKIVTIDVNYVDANIKW